MKKIGSRHAAKAVPINHENAVDVYRFPIGVGNDGLTSGMTILSFARSLLVIHEKAGIYFFARIILVFMFLSVPLPATLSWADAQKEVEAQLMCMCRDKCGKVLESCVCQYSEQYRMDITMKLKEGLTKEQVIQTYVERYGEIALSAPTKKGFNLTVWITPFFAILIGGIGIRRVVAKWVALRKDEKQNKITEPKDDQKDSKYSRLLEKELKEFD